MRAAGVDGWQGPASLALTDSRATTRGTGSCRPTLTGFVLPPADCTCWCCCHETSLTINTCQEFEPQHLKLVVQPRSVGPRLSLSLLLLLSRTWHLIVTNFISKSSNLIWRFNIKTVNTSCLWFGELGSGSRSALETSSDRSLVWSGHVASGSCSGSLTSGHQRGRRPSQSAGDGKVDPSSTWPACRPTLATWTQVFTLASPLNHLSDAQENLYAAHQ